MYVMYVCNVTQCNAMQCNPMVWVVWYGMVLYYVYKIIYVISTQPFGSVGSLQIPPLGWAPGPFAQSADPPPRRRKGTRWAPQSYRSRASAWVVGSVNPKDMAPPFFFGNFKGMHIFLRGFENKIGDWQLLFLFSSVRTSNTWDTYKFYKSKVPKNLKLLLQLPCDFQSIRQVTRSGERFSGELFTHFWGTLLISFVCKYPIPAWSGTYHAHTHTIQY
jgi:hypothetical protein